MVQIKEIRFKKLKDMTREELTINRQHTLKLINETTNSNTKRQETKYLEKINNEIRKRNNNGKK